VQVVDRFHLAQNLRQALEAFLLDRRLVLQDAAVSRAIALLPTASPFPLTPMYRGRRRRRTRHARRRTPAGSPSMRPYTRSGRRGRPSPPWPGSWGSAARPCMPTSFVMVCPAATRSADAQRYLDQLCQMEANIARAHELSHAFLTMVRERRGIDLAAWMAEAMPSGIEALARFARGLQEDLAAIAAGLTLDWSNGPVEGQITRLTLLKRQAYGRAGFPLLRQRIRHAA
jgi:Transposase